MTGDDRTEWGLHRTDQPDQIRLAADRKHALEIAKRSPRFRGHDVVIVTRTVTTTTTGWTPA